MRYGEKTPLQDIELVVSSPVAGHIRKGMGGESHHWRRAFCFPPEDINKIKPATGYENSKRD